LGASARTVDQNAFFVCCAIPGCRNSGSWGDAIHGLLTIGTGAFSAIVDRPSAKAVAANAPIKKSFVFSACPLLEYGTENRFFLLRDCFYFRENDLDYSD
jgi:hypothetical protein